MTAVLLAPGCGSGDTGQRKAFVDFLQTRVLDKPGMHVPQLTADERASFGDYADDFAIITDFNKTMNDSVSPKLAAAVGAGSIASLEDVVAHRAQLQTAKTGMAAMSRALDADIARADAAHGKLDQPADLKQVYDKAYDRLVTQPATAFKAVVPVMDKVLGETIDLGGYLDAHRSAIRISGSMVQTSDATVRAAINDRLQALQANQRAVQTAQAKMQSAVYGR
ncbi:MAG TPA: DUF3053 family protein [Sphingomonas sp.]|nr:DUF3053 family protein [Sphingomonas sp.]